MYFWFIILALIALVGVAAIYYSGIKIRNFILNDFVASEDIKSSKFQTFLCIVFVIFIVIIFAVFGGYMNAIVILLHFTIVSLILDFIKLIISAFKDRPVGNRVFTIIAILITGLYLGYAYYNCHNIQVTKYSYNTYKTKESLKILAFSDVHMGTTIDTKKIYKMVEQMNDEKADIVLIVGDLVDDDTSKKELEECCKALGNLKSKYGVYFSYGNHDKGYANSSKRGWTYDDLERLLAENNVKVLKDEELAFGNNFNLIGRLDKSAENEDHTGRKQMSDWAIDDNKFNIVMDHQPADFNNEAASGVDLVLCGHTHGGQLIPINHVGEWIGVNDLRYGQETRERTNFIVNSGVSCWALDFKTGCISEYLVITIN